MSVKVLLKRDVAKLGKFGTIVSVSKGYARNYLIPTKIASLATKENIAFFEVNRLELAKQNDIVFARAEEASALLNDVSVDIYREASDDGRLYGSVSKNDIAEALSKLVESVQFVVDGYGVLINDRIKELGTYKVDIALHPRITVSVTVNVVRLVHA